MEQRTEERPDKANNEAPVTRAELNPILHEPMKLVRDPALASPIEHDHHLQQGEEAHLRVSEVEEVSTRGPYANMSVKEV